MPAAHSTVAHEEDSVEDRGRLAPHDMKPLTCRQRILRAVLDTLQLLLQHVLLQLLGVGLARLRVLPGAQVAYLLGHHIVGATIASRGDCLFVVISPHPVGSSSSSVSWLASITLRRIFWHVL